MYKCLYKCFIFVNILYFVMLYPYACHGRHAFAGGLAGVFGEDFLFLLYCIYNIASDLFLLIVLAMVVYVF